MNIQTDLLSLTPSQWQALYPYLALVGGSFLSLLASFVHPFGSKKSSFWIFFLCVMSCLSSGWFNYTLLESPHVILWNGSLVSDGYAQFFHFLFLGIGILTLFISFPYCRKEGLLYPEYPILIVLCLVGMLLLSAAQNLIVLFIALELLSLALYILVGFRRNDLRSNEAALKYFMMGGVASAVLLYGIALIYGTTGSLSLQSLYHFLRENSEQTQSTFLIGISLVLIGFLFKVASAPFHTWLPDVYEGAPLPITAFMATGIKAAAFSVAIRILIIFGFESLDLAIGSLALLTIAIGNCLALWQHNLKRLFAYSSIAHTGYLLIGTLIASQSDFGQAPILFYLLTYSIPSLGLFFIFSLLTPKGEPTLALHHLSGLAQRHPFVGFCMTVFLFSLAGIPPMAGFVGKYFLFTGAIQAHWIKLTLAALLLSVAGVAYSLKILMFLYMKEPTSETPTLSLSSATVCALFLFALWTLYLGCFPQFWLHWSERALLHVF